MPPAPDLSMPLAEAMRTQRAIRRLTTDLVDDALVLELISLARKAPSAQGQEQWEFIVVRDPAVKAKLARQNRFLWRLYRPVADRKGRREEKFARMTRAVQWQADHFEDIPVLVVVCFRGSRLAWPPILGASTYGSIFPAIQNLLLAARAAGLGATLTTMPLWWNWNARRILGLPWSITPTAVIPLGWPRGRYGPTTRKPVGEVVSLDRYGHRPWTDVADTEPA